MVMENWFWSIAILLTHPYQKIIGLVNASEVNLKSPDSSYIEAGIKQDLNFPPGFDESSTLPLELTLFTGPQSPLPPWPATPRQLGPTAPALCSSHVEPPQLNDLQSPLPRLTAALEELGPTELPHRNRYGSQLDSFIKSSTFGSDPNILLGSTSHYVIPETDLEAQSSKRTKIQMLPGRHLFTSLNYIPTSDKPAINARSRPLKGLPTASTDPHDPIDGSRHRPGLVHPLIFSTDIDCTQDHPVLPILNHQLEFSQTCIHRQNNLKENPTHISNHPMASDVALEIPALPERDNDQLSRALNNGELEKIAKKMKERKKMETHTTVAVSSRASTASRKSWKGNSLQKTYLFDYRWAEFKPSKIDGQLVSEVLENVTIEDGTNFFNFVAGLNHLQELDDTIQNKWPQKVFRLESSPLPNCNQFFQFFSYLTHSRSTQYKPQPEDRITLYSLTRQRFVLNPPNDDLSPHQHKIEAYKTHVLSDFMKLVESCEESGVKDFESNITSQNSEVFQRAVKLVPIYIFYIDLISTLVPVQALDTDSQAFRIQREDAGKCFLELIQEAHLHDMKRGLNYDKSEYRRSTLIHDFTKIVQRVSIGQAQTWSLVWKAIEYWALTSRKDLLMLHNCGGAHFKEFFNTLVFNWVAEKRLILAGKNYQLTWDSQKGRNSVPKCFLKRKKEEKERVHY